MPQRSSLRDDVIVLSTPAHRTLQPSDVNHRHAHLTDSTLLCTLVSRDSSACCRASLLRSTMCQLTCVRWQAARQLFYVAGKAYTLNWDNINATAPNSGTAKMSVRNLFEPALESQP